MSEKIHKRRADGRIQKQVTIKNQITGEKIVKTVYGYSEHELELAEDKVKELYGTVVHTDFTFYQYLIDYISQKKSELDGDDGRYALDNNEGHINNYIKNTVLGNTPIMNMAVYMFREFFTNFKPKKKGVTGKRTKQLLYTILKTALTQAVYDGYISENPLNKIRRPDYKSKPKSIVTEEQLDHILVLAKKYDPQFANLFIFDVVIGLRRSEILALKFTDIDFKNKTLKVTKGIKRLKGKGTYIGDTKNHTSVRTLPIDEFSFNILRDQLKRAKNNPVKNGGMFRMNSYVFHDENGEPFKPDRATRCFQRCREELNYPTTMTLHSLRHTAATHIAEHGIGTREMQTWFGWSTGAMADRYTHGTDAMKNKIVNILNTEEKDRSVKKSVKAENE